MKIGGERTARKTKAAEARSSAGSVAILGQVLNIYPVRTIAMLVCLVFAGFAEGIGLVTLLPVLESVSGSGDGTGSTVGRLLITGIANMGIAPSLEALLTIMVVGIALKAGLIFLAMVQVGYAMAQVSSDIRLGIVRSLVRARWLYFIHQPVGTFSAGVGTEANSAAAAYMNSCRLIAATVQVAIYLVVAALVSWQMTFSGVVAGTIIVIALGRFVGMTRRAGGRQVTAMNELVSRLTDLLQGIKPIKAMAAEDNVTPLLEHETQELKQALRLGVISFEVVQRLREPLAAVMIAVGLFVSVGYMEMKVESLVVLAFLFYRMVGFVGLVQRAYQSLAGNEAAYRTVYRKIADAEAMAETAHGRTPPTLVDAIRFERVEFSFGTNKVLREISLIVPAGRLTSIFGPSGAGKTTLSDLIVGLFFPDQGRITIDGVDLRTIDLGAWRALIGYVPQEMFLFHDTVLHNVTLGRAGLGEAEAEEALRAAGAWQFVTQLPDGLHSVVGERGTSVSGGQRQRIAIARALVHKPRFLVLDEPTTALDPATEAEICDTLRMLHGEVTILAISHQSALAEISDVVYEMRDGSVWQINSEADSQSAASAVTRK